MDAASPAGRAPARVGVAGLVVAVALGCGGARDEARCTARQALRDAVGAVAAADRAEADADPAAVDRAVGQAERLIATARGKVSRSSTRSVDRRMLEAAEYLTFIVEQYRVSGVVDGTLAQFATRELNRAPDPGEAPLSC